MLFAMADDGVGEIFELFGGDDAPKFSRQGDVCYFGDGLGEASCFL